MDYLGHPYIDPDNVLPKNLMSYWNCRQEFTSGQNIRMRDVLADDNVIGQVVSPFSHIRIVSGTEEWTTPKYFNHDLQIDGNLTISTEVGFAPGYGIILNGILQLEDGTITISPYENTCPGVTGKLWKGIQINRSSTNTPGLYISDLSTIEHADQAIFFKGTGNQYVIASNSTFKNNRISYNNIRSLGGPAKFTKCNFIIDDDYLLQSYFPQIITIHSAPILIGGCQFTFEPDLPGSVSRQAISSYDGQILVTTWGLVRSEFNNWTEAIRVVQNDGSRLTVVKGAKFVGNSKGIYDFNFQRIMAYNNTFDLSNETISDESWGIFSEGARLINFHNNEFSSTNSSIFTTGIHALGSETENVVIGESDFTDLDVAVEAINSGKESGGMSFLCNRNSGNRLFDFKTEHGIGPKHGTNAKPAGNTFSHVDNEDHDSDFRAVDLPGNFDVNYFYNRTDPDQTPLYISSSVIPHQVNTGNCDHFILFQDPVDSTQFSKYLDRHDELLDDISNKQDELNQPNLTSTQIINLSAELYYLELERDLNASDAVAFVLTRDTIDFENLRTAIDLRENFALALAKAHTYLCEGDTSAMFEELEAIEGHLNLSQDEEDDLSQRLLLDSMLNRVYSEGRIEDALTAYELDTVESIADDGVGFARYHARALLCYFYDQCYDAEIPFQSSSEFDKIDESSDEAVNLGLIESQDYNLKSANYNNCKVNVYSMDGRLIRSLRNEIGPFNSQDGELQDLPPGLYLIHITGSNGNECLRKWIR